MLTDLADQNQKFASLLTEVLTYTLTTIEQIDNILIEYICDTSDALKYYLENEQNKFWLKKYNGCFRFSL